MQVSEADADSNNSAAGIMDLANLGIRKRVVQLNVDDKKVSVGSEATGKIQSSIWPCFIVCLRYFGYFFEYLFEHWNRYKGLYKNLKLDRKNTL